MKKKNKGLAAIAQQEKYAGENVEQFLTTARLKQLTICNCFLSI